MVENMTWGSDLWLNYGFIEVCMQPRVARSTTGTAEVNAYQMWQLRPCINKKIIFFWFFVMENFIEINEKMVGMFRFKIDTEN